MRKALAALAAVVIVLLPAAPAWAHAQLVSADPAEDASLARAPASVTLTFSERLNPEFTTIVVSDAARQRIPAAAPTVDAGKGTVSLTQPLSNGAYTVAYRVVSVDGHTVQGSYPFTVADPTRPAAAAASQPAVARADRSTGISTPVLIGLGAFGVLCVLVVAYLYVSGRRRAARREQVVPARDGDVVQPAQTGRLARE
ncbi:copper homeostasis periplasmic binding protein CopC [Actinoplanes friuliensis]|uniref:Putative copper resistance protein CopC n=1 Tax=Actinoplanes friuliensis DSM 7358 TaxID=1246995 RepID=U5VZM8_9ACTN|nr:copper homeostasis periplasmic binding protein CopC [Actinoplanes friuliensis]AGZ41096.1 putative copper resistance protein CopC [Actinoplanes friuliensis DSM 7358]